MRCECLTQNCNWSTYSAVPYRSTSFLSSSTRQQCIDPSAQIQKFKIPLHSIALSKCYAAWLTRRIRCCVCSSPMPKYAIVIIMSLLHFKVQDWRPISCLKPVGALSLRCWRHQQHIPTCFTTASPTAFKIPFTIKHLPLFQSIFPNVNRLYDC